MDFLVLIAYYLLACGVVTVIAVSRGRGGVKWFIYALLASPLLMGILVIALPSEADAPNPQTHVKCPDCVELVRAEARVCKYCGCKLKPSTGDNGGAPA